MTLLLSNILPSDRNANLPLQKYQLVCVVPTWVSMHMVQLISDTIYCLQGSHPQRHPVDPEKSNRALGFPALVTGLYQSYRVLVPPGKVM